MQDSRHPTDAAHLWGSGLGAQGFSFEVWCLEFEVQGLGFRV